MADYFETMRSWRAIETPTVPERTPLETDVDTAYDEYIGNLEKSTSDLSDDNVMKDVLDSFLASRGEDPQSLSLPTPEKRLGLYKTLALKPPPPSEGTLTLGSRSWYNDPEEGYNLLAPPMTYEEFLKRRYGLDLVDLFAGPPEPRTTPPDQPNLPVVTDDNWGQGLVTPEMQRQNPVWRFLQDTYPGQHTKTGLVEYTIDDEAAISLVPTSPKTLKIDSLRALEKNTGAGTRALNLLSQQADKHGVSLEGLIHKFEEEGLSKADLLKFYQKAGWELRYPDKVRRSLSEGKAIEDIRVEVIRAPRPPDQPNLPALLGPPEEPGKKPSSKGRMVRGIGSLMRRRIFPLIQAAQMGFDLLPEDKKFAGDFIDYLKETKTHELFGMDKSGLDYFRDLLGMKQSEPEGGITSLSMDEASRMARAEEQGYNLDAYHGTRDDFTIFEKGDLGYHFGTPEQAWARLTETRGTADWAPHSAEENIIPVKLRLRNPLELPDVGSWQLPEVIAQRALETRWGKGHSNELNTIIDEAAELSRTFADLDDWADSPEASELMDELRSLIKEDGYDGIKYRNIVESKYGKEGGGLTVEGHKQYEALNKEWHELRRAISIRDQEARGPLPDHSEATPEKIQEWLNRHVDTTTPEERARLVQLSELKETVRKNLS